MMPFNGYGSYLIRNSETTPGDYMLCVQDKERVRHYRIKQLENGTFFVTRRVSFETLVDLVTYYQQQADGLFTNLIKPCVRYEKPQIPGLSRQVNTEWVIDRRQIRLVGKLMSNMYIELWEGVWNETVPVAVKIFRPQENVTMDNLLQTANLMLKLSHPNIIQIYAVCTKIEPIYIISELMKYNSLLEFLSGEGRSMKLPQLIDMASEVASGMAYLEEHNVIHRDLGARNISISNHSVCKIVGFELAGEINKDTCIIKWTAPEAAMYNRFSIKSDVWSFGIVLYEIITYGRFPYGGMTNDQVLDQLQQGYRMPRPMGCPDDLHDIMLHCWRADPDSRYTFETLKWQLEEFFIEDGCYHRQY